MSTTFPAYPLEDVLLGATSVRTYNPAPEVLTLLHESCSPRSAPAAPNVVDGGLVVLVTMVRGSCRARAARQRRPHDEGYWYDRILVSLPVHGHFPLPNCGAQRPRRPDSAIERQLKALPYVR